MKVKTAAMRPIYHVPSRNMGVSDGKQRRISEVNAETVYAQYNARYAAIIP